MHLASGTMNYITLGGGEMRKGLLAHNKSHLKTSSVLGQSLGPLVCVCVCVCVCVINSKHVHSVLWFIKILLGYFIHHQGKYLKRR